MGLLSAMLKDTPTALWPFDGGRSGRFAASDWTDAFVDIAGSYPMGKVGGGWSPGPGQAPILPGSKLNTLGCLPLNGSNYPTRAYDAALDVGTGDFAVELWFKYTGADYGSPLGNYVEIFSRDAGASGHGVILYGYIGTGVPRFWCANAVANGSVNVCDNKTHQVVVQRISGTAYAYVDGALDVSFSAVGDTNRSSPINIGIVDSSYHDFDGWFGPVAYYMHGLTAGEVAAHWTAGLSEGVSY